MPTNIDEILADKGTIIISRKTLIWILGVLISGITTLGGYMWNANAELNAKIEESNKEIIKKLETLEREEIKSNTSKIFDNKYSIGILLDRTNSRYTIIDGSAERPTSPTPTTPTVPGAPPTN